MTPNTRKTIADAKTNTAALAATFEALNVPVRIENIGNRPILVAPGDIELTDMSEYLPAPQRIRQHVKLDTPDALVAYVNAFGDKTNTMMFAKEGDGRLVAILDYHAPGAPSWGDHAATCQLSDSPAWQAWASKDGVAMNQETFSQFLEDHITEIARPDATELVKITRTLEVSKNLTFKSHMRADDGAMTFVYDEDVKGTAQGGTMKIPSEFALAIAPFNGMAAVAVNARLRFRVSGGALALTFHLIDRARIHREAFGALVSIITSATADRVRAVVMGAPA